MSGAVSISKGALRAERRNGQRCAAEHTDLKGADRHPPGDTAKIAGSGCNLGGALAEAECAHQSVACGLPIFGGMFPKPGFGRPAEAASFLSQPREQTVVLAARLVGGDVERRGCVQGGGAAHHGIAAAKKPLADAGLFWAHAGEEPFEVGALPVGGGVGAAAHGAEGHVDAKTFVCGMQG